MPGMEEQPALMGYRHAASLADGRAVSMTLADGLYPRPAWRWISAAGPSAAV